MGEIGETGEPEEPPSRLGRTVKPPSRLGRTVKPPSRLGRLVKPQSTQGRTVRTYSTVGKTVEPPCRLGRTLRLASQLGRSGELASQVWRTVVVVVILSQGVVGQGEGSMATGMEEVARQGRADDTEAEVTAMLLESTNSKNQYLADGGITVYENEEFSLMLAGSSLAGVRAVRFTTTNNSRGDGCRGDGSYHNSETYTELEESRAGLRRLVVRGGLKYWSDGRTYYLCVATVDPVEDNFIHQGDATTLTIFMDRPFLPMWVMVLLIFVLLCLSGLFSGLNLGLMSLDQTELKIVQNTGTDTERGYATAIQPIRAMGNFLLCSILLGNVLVNNTLTVMLDTLTGGGGLVAVIGATMGIVVFGEIIPQAICSRHGLAVGAKTIWLTKFFMLLTAPLSFPISKVLDCLLGTEIGTVYNKTRLMELLKVTEQYNGLERDEINIVTGALVLKQKSVKDVMTNIQDCFMLPLDAKLDFDTVSDIKEQGYSRIPVYEGEKTNVLYILFAKDLLFIDPDDEKPVEEICKYYRHDVNFVYSDTILTDMFDEFKSGEKGHLALVQEVNRDADDADPFYETVGLVTLEDIIEEIIQQEIIDETDVVIDNKSKKKRKRNRYKKDSEVKMFQGARHMVNITPHENMAVLQFLTTSVGAFSPEIMGENILRKLLSMDVYRELKIGTKNSEDKPDDKSHYIMTKGKFCDFFIMIIEGRVEVTIGREERKYHDGPFSCYGEQSLKQSLVTMTPASPMVASRINLSLSMQSAMSQDLKTLPNLKKTTTGLQVQEKAWVPDYTVKALTDVLYLKVRRNTYTVAIKATRMALGSEPMTENDLSDVLAKVIENDPDDDLSGKTPSVRSPDKVSQGEDSELRRESIRSSLTAMKQKLLGGGKGRSNSSIDRSGERKDDFWDGSVQEVRGAASSPDTGSSLNSRKEPGGPQSSLQGGGGPQSLPPAVQPPATLPLREKAGAAGGRRNSIARMEAGEGQVVTNGNTTVILVRGNTEELGPGHSAS